AVLLRRRVGRRPGHARRTAADPRAGHGVAVARGAVPWLRPPAPARVVARRAAEGDHALAVRSRRARCLLLPGPRLARPAGEGTPGVAGRARRRHGPAR